MNERIRELELEAANWARQNHQAVDPENLTKQEYEQRVLMMIEKFSELIVEECGRVADVFCHIWCEEDKPQDVTVSNYIKRHVLRADPE